MERLQHPLKKDQENGKRNGINIALIFPQSLMFSPDPFSDMEDID